MAVFAAPRGRYTLIQNHEIDPGARFGIPNVEGTVYDPGATDAGGCTVITTDRRGRNLGEFVALSGTASNCAGGPTPWDTWLTCEETEDRAGDQWEEGGRTGPSKRTTATSSRSGVIPGLTKPRLVSDRSCPRC